MAFSKHWLLLDDGYEFLLFLPRNNTFLNLEKKISIYDFSKLAYLNGVNNGDL